MNFKHECLFIVVVTIRSIDLLYDNVMMLFLFHNVVFSSYRFVQLPSPLS